MGIQWKQSLCILPLLLATSYAQFFGLQRFFFNPNEIFNRQKILGPHELFGNPFGNPQDYRDQRVPDDFGTLPFVDNTDDTFNHDHSSGTAMVPLIDYGTSGEIVEGEGENMKKIEIDWNKIKGSWKLVSQNSGVSAMHSILLANSNKVLMYDATIWKASKIQLPPGRCRIADQATGEKDCWAHSVLYDIETAELTPLELNTDTWCSSGGLTVDGEFVSTGGFQGGANTVRYLGTCEGCNWKEYPAALAAPRWYSTQAELPDGDFIVVGGREAFSYEYIPAEGASNAKPYFFDFLKQTSDKEENNLYPFVHLSTDGNLFIFANDRSILLSPKTNNIIKEFPALPGGHRNYPASGMSVLLPIKLFANPIPNKPIPAEVLICGGSAHADSYSKAEKGIFYTALRDCGRIRITENKPVWKRELMPSPRIMGDMMILPNGDVLLLNGAKRGASGWGFAREPNFTPVLYNPRAKKGLRFRELTPTTIPRMYHSSSTVLPDGRVLVAGSNTNNGYIYNAMFPTELRVEKFSPPYLDPSLAAIRPEIIAEETGKEMGYGQAWNVYIKNDRQPSRKEDLKVTMYAPAFTTHGVSMNQRLVILGIEKVYQGQGTIAITVVTPPSGAIAPPGYYLLSVVRQGVPSVSTWVRLA